MTDFNIRQRLNTPVLRLPLLLLAMLAGGCAQLPAPQALPQLKSHQAFATSESFRTTATSAREWPGETWWTAYGDAQLNSLIEKGLRDAPDMQVAAARLQRAEAMTQQMGSATKPQVSANASASVDKLSYNHLVPRTPATEGWNDYGRATLDLRWNMDFWGKNRASLSAATSELDARRAEMAQARLMLASAIASEYAELGRLHAQRDLAVQAVRIRNQTVKLLAQRQSNGLENQGSVRAAEAAASASDGALLALDEQLALQRHRIAALLGQGPDRGLAIQPPKLSIDKAFGLPAQLPADLLGRRPDVVAARLMAKAQASRIEEKQAEFYPNVNLSAFIGVQSLGLDMLGKSGSGVGSIGPAISLPIFSGGRLQGELRGAQADYAQSVARYNATVAQALNEVADAAVSQRALGQRLDKAQQAVDASSQVHGLARKRHEGGLASALEVLSTEDALLANLTQQIQLRAQSLTLDIALHRALGGGYESPSAQTLTTR